MISVGTPYSDPPDTQAQETDRIRRALDGARRIRLDALSHVAVPNSHDAVFARRDPAGFDDGDLRHLQRLLWHYRRVLPRWLAPRANPDDPIVIELETQDRAMELADG